MQFIKHLLSNGTVAGIMLQGQECIFKSDKHGFVSCFVIS